MFAQHHRTTQRLGQPNREPAAREADVRVHNVNRSVCPFDLVRHALHSARLRCQAASEYMPAELDPLKTMNQKVALKMFGLRALGAKPTPQIRESVERVSGRDLYSLSRRCKYMYFNLWISPREKFRLLVKENAGERALRGGKPRRND